MIVSYAQNFEDVILARLFSGRNHGFYIDVGAGDPIRFSITKWFYEQGWCGINIEPNSYLYKRLVLDRPRDINLNCGAGAQSGKVAFYEMDVPELSTFDPDLA